MYSSISKVSSERKNPETLTPTWRVHDAYIDIDVDREKKKQNETVHRIPSTFARQRQSIVYNYKNKLGTK
jgi:hypothetical protein